jgi:ABC-type bacteriocin/lantibiotic exporter with double-glycine peptidase domain
MMTVMLSLALSLVFSLAHTPRVAEAVTKIPQSVAAVPPSAPIPAVPFYSQFADITSPKWQKVGCGVASLAMIIDYYKPAVSVNTLLTQAVAKGAYNENAGWSYAGLISVSKGYGLDGTAYDLGSSDTKTAYAALKKAVGKGPVIASVHYKFDPKSTIPHLVVIDGIKDDVIYYNDPAAKSGEKKISSADFLAAWKKRYIAIRPTAHTDTLALAQPAAE